MNMYKSLINWPQSTSHYEDDLF